MKLTRAHVYALIDGERAYQDNLPSTRKTRGVRTVGEFLILFQTYLADAAQAWTKQDGDDKALDVVRKLGGIAVQCMEIHGAPHRMGCPPSLAYSPEVQRSNQVRKQHIVKEDFKEASHEHLLALIQHQNPLDFLAALMTRIEKDGTTHNQRELLSAAVHDLDARPPAT